MSYTQIFSGQDPYNDVDSRVLIRLVVEKHTRPKRPERLSELEVWDIIQNCWTFDPKSRPTAKQVAALMTSLTTEENTEGE